MVIRLLKRQYLPKNYLITQLSKLDRCHCRNTSTIAKQDYKRFAFQSIQFKTLIFKYLNIVFMYLKLRLKKFEKQLNYLLNKIQLVINNYNKNYSAYILILQQHPSKLEGSVVNLQTTRSTISTIYNLEKEPFATTLRGIFNIFSLMWITFSCNFQIQNESGFLPGFFVGLKNNTRHEII